jgi:lipopolysaccharide biosynthesis glycosyltransferase
MRLELCVLIACCIDANYAELAGVMFRSVNVNGNVPNARFLILGDGLSAENKRNIRLAAGSDVQFIDLTRSMIKRINGFRTTAHWSRSTYSRLILPEMLPEDVSTIIYLDADTIIKSDISDLANLSLGDNLIAGVSATGHTTTEQYNEHLGRPLRSFYFNAGVLVLNARKWRREGLTEAAFNRKRSFPCTLPRVV